MLREKLVWERIKEPFIKIIDFSVIAPVDIFFFLSKIINKKFGYEKYVQIKIKTSKEKLFNILNFLLLIFFRSINYQTFFS